MDPVSTPTDPHRHPAPDARVRVQAGDAVVADGPAWARAALFAVPAVWLGLLIGISLIEAPLKFTAPGITIPLGLGIGRRVFFAMNLVEVVLAVVLLVSGLIEALVTPSPLPTVARVAIGVAAEVAFLAYVVHFGRRAVRAGETGDLDDAPDLLPTG